MNAKTQLDFERPFRIWSYIVSHNQLLLRSTKGTDAKTRIDVLFKNVSLINIASNLDGLVIEEAGPDEIRLDCTDVHLKGRKVFRVTSRNCQGYVVAGAVVVHEDEGDYLDPSVLLPN